MVVLNKLIKSSLRILWGLLSSLYKLSILVNKESINIPLNRTTDICIDKLHNNNETPPKISKANFHNMFNTTNNTIL